ELGHFVPLAALRTSVFRAPVAEHGPGEDAGVVAVVPAQGDAPAADELGAGRLQHRGLPRAGPDRLGLLSAAPALGARAVHSQLGEVEAVLGAVGPADREARGPVQVDRLRRRLFGEVHGHGAESCRYV